MPDSGMGRRHTLHWSQPDEVGNGCNCSASYHQQSYVRDEVRNYHEGKATHEGDDGSLLLAVQKVAEANRPEQDAP